MELNIRQFFTPAAVGQYLEELPDLETFIMDLVYPNRPTHPLPVLGIDELMSATGNVPLVRRGTTSYSLSGESKGLSYLEPEPVDVSSFLGAKDLNNLKLLGDKGVEFWARGKVDNQRRAVRATTEALACQSLTGKISYPMKTDSGLDTFEIDFGSVLSLNITKKWDAETTTLADILLQLITLGKTIKKKAGYGSRIVYLAGEAAFVALASKVLALGNDNRIAATITEKGIVIAGFVVTLASGGYKDLTNGSWVPAVDDKNVLAIALDAPFKIWYCALDDLDANLLPMPFYSKPIKTDDPSGYKIKGMSKPVPVPVPNAICKGVATS